MKNIKYIFLILLVIILPSRVFGAFTGVQWAGAPWAISTAGVVTIGDTSVSCTGSETVHFMVQQYSFSNPYSGADADGWAKTTGYNNVGCSGGVATPTFGTSGGTYNLESSVTGGGNPALKEYYLFAYRDGLGCSWLDNSCTGDNAVAGNVKLIRTATGVSTFTWTIETGAPADVSTRFIDVTPYDKSVVNPATAPYSATSTATVTVSADIYFNDVESGNYIDQVCVYLEKIDGVGQSLIPVCSNIITSGASTVDMVFTNLPWGRYFAIYNFSNSSFEKFKIGSLEFVNQYTLTSGGNQSCLFGNDIIGFCNNAPSPDGYSSTTPVTFTGLELDDCSTYSTWDGDKAICSVVNTLKRMVNVLFVPSGSSFTYFISGVTDNALTKFPFGYIYDFKNKLSTTTVGSLVAFDATLPIFGNPHIQLDLTHKLDPYLNATTSTFFNSDIASSTETFYDVTSYYWKIFMYLFALMYMLSRVIGSQVIPSGSSASRNSDYAKKGGYGPFKD